MANTRDIRRRIRSVKNTAQITKAMQLVAASKMKKAQDQAIAGRPYADLLNKVLVNLKDRVDDIGNPLLQDRGEEGRVLYLVVTTDKGLCGALNTNLMRKVLAEAPSDAGFVTVGRKGSQTIGRLKRDLVADFPVGDPAPFSDVKPVAKFVTEQFSSGEFGKVKVAFTNFITTLTQEPYVETLLPLSPITIGRKREFKGMGTDASEEKSDAELTVPYIFEPSPERVLDSALPQFINFTVYQMILEARASEHSARMVAMKSATDNAMELVDDLTLEYNKVRQAAITNELLEITTAMKALE